MASATCSLLLNAPNLFLLTVFSMTLLVTPKANDQLKVKACHNAFVPTTCRQCLDSNPRSEMADQLGIVNIILGCIDTHADSLVRNVTLLARTRRREVKQALDQCKAGFLMSKKQLSDASRQLSSHDYDKAGRSIWTAIAYTQACESRLQNLEYDVPNELYFEMRIYNELSDAAVKNIERL